MKWNEYIIETTTQAEDLVVASLLDLGVEGVEIVDRIPLTEKEKAEMFVDILPIQEDDGCAYIHFYLPYGEDHNVLLQQIRAELDDLQQFVDVGSGQIVEKETDDEDWLHNWKKYFKQFTVGDILIKPSWEEVQPADREKILIQIDPGVAFGTGMHETTQLCIRALQTYLRQGDRVLDLGCGSGILSIAALKLGASYTVGTDLDPCAISATGENMAVNGLSEQSYAVIQGNVITDEELCARIGEKQYDIVVANILAEILEGITPVAMRMVKKGGYYITSGIIEEREAFVREFILRAGFEIIAVNKQKDWVSFVARRPE
ncbi:MAG: 50S ribosomal protein L11 methyltransferase [Eubacteriales bacterium]|nr:50S ribosomal protein L11 methyltransferase [Eubacteriales bacterium]